MRGSFGAPWLALLLAGAAPAPPQAPPRPDIVVNCSDGPVALSPSAALSLELRLDAGASAGQIADWFLIASTPLGWYANQAGTWIPTSPTQIIPLYQGPLANLPPTEVLYVAGLPPGSYSFYFGVDTVPNGRVDVDHLQFDAVAATLAAASSATPFPPTPNIHQLALGE